MSLKDRLEEEDETQTRDLAWYKQWGWRRFLSNLILFFMLLGMVSFMMTYLITKYLLSFSEAMAMLSTVVHLVIFASLMGLDALREIQRVSSATYLYGTWHDSVTKSWMIPAEILWYEPLELDKLFGANPHPPVLVNAVERRVDTSRYNNYMVALGSNIENPLRVFMIRKPFTWETALVAHQETVYTRYPIKSRVINATFALMLAQDYEDTVLPVYELVFTSGMLPERQKGLKWFLPSSEEVSMAFGAFDNLQGTKHRMISYAKQGLINRLLDVIKELKNMGDIVSAEAIENYLMTQGVGTKQWDVKGWFARNKFKIMAIVASIAIVALLWYYVVPILNPPIETPPTGG